MIFRSYYDFVITYKSCQMITAYHDIFWQVIAYYFPPIKERMNFEVRRKTSPHQMCIKQSS